MSWKQQLLDKLTDILRFTLKACLFINAFLVSLFSIWFCVRFIFRLMQWLEKVAFSEPW